MGSKERKIVEIEDRSLGEVLEFMQLFWAVEHGLERISKKAYIEYGVTGPQRLAIRLIGKNPGVAASELAKALRVHPSTMTGIMKRLQQSGLVARKVDPVDARRGRFTLTAAGKTLDQLKSRTAEHVVRAALAKARSSDVAATRRVLSSLAETLERKPSRKQA